VLNPWYGTILGCAVPHRPGEEDGSMRAEDAMFAREATWTSERDTSTCCPSPVFSRYNSAAKILLHV